MYELLEERDVVSQGVRDMDDEEYDVYDLWYSITTPGEEVARPFLIRADSYDIRDISRYRASTPVENDEVTISNASTTPPHANSYGHEPQAESIAESFSDEMEALDTSSISPPSYLMLDDYVFPDVPQELEEGYSRFFKSGLLNTHREITRSVTGFWRRLRNSWVG